MNTINVHYQMGAGIPAIITERPPKRFTRMSSSRRSSLVAKRRIALSRILCSHCPLMKQQSDLFFPRKTQQPGVWLWSSHRKQLHHETFTLMQTAKVLSLKSWNRAPCIRWLVEPYRRNPIGAVRGEFESSQRNDSTNRNIDGHCR